MTTLTHPLHDVYREHGRAVHQVALVLCGPAGADDVTHDVFVDMWHHPEAYVPSCGSLRAFLVAGARHRALRMPRRLGDVAPDVPAADLSSHVAALPADERDAIVVSHHGGCSLREAALVLGVSEAEVASKTRSGLRRLRDAADATHRGSATAVPAQPRGLAR